MRQERHLHCTSHHNGPIRDHYDGRAHINSQFEGTHHA